MVHTVVSANGAFDGYANQHKVVRTSDGTIHVVVERTGYTTHYYSYDNGATWSSDDLWSTAYHASIAASSYSDNLIVVGANGGGNAVTKKGAVNKGVTPWTWTWTDGGEVPYGPHDYPDIVYGATNVIGDSSDQYICIFSHTNNWNCPARYYSTNGGTIWSYEEVVDIYSGYGFATLEIDSNDNIFQFWGSSYSDYYFRSQRVTSANWKQGTGGESYVTVSSTIDMKCPCVRKTSDGHLLWLGMDDDYYHLRFRKATNVNSNSPWDTEVDLVTLTSSDYYNYSLMVISSTRYRAYYTTGGVLYYKESTDSGATWGAAQTVYSAIYSTYVSCPKNCISYADYIWTGHQSDPYDIFQDTATFAIHVSKSITEILGASDSQLQLHYKIHYKAASGYENPPYRATHLVADITVGSTTYRLGVITGLELNLQYGGGLEPQYGSREQLVNIGVKEIQAKFDRMFYTDNEQQDLLSSLFANETLFTLSIYLINNNGVKFNKAITLLHCKLYDWKPTSGGAADSIITEKATIRCTDWEYG